MEKIEGTLKTKIGNVRYAITDGSHVFLGTSSGYEQGDPFVELRGVEYTFSLPLFLQEDGKWACKSDARIHMTRRDFREPSFPARRDVTEIVTAAWNEFIRQHPALPVEAEIEFLRQKCASIVKDRRELEEQVEEKTAELLKTADAEALAEARLRKIKK